MLHAEDRLSVQHRDDFAAVTDVAASAYSRCEP